MKLQLRASATVALVFAIAACRGTGAEDEVASGTQSAATTGSRAESATADVATGETPEDSATETESESKSGGGCPSSAPEAGSKCDSASVPSDGCGYGTNPDCPDTFVCVDDAWVYVAQFTCPPPPPPPATQCPGSVSHGDPCNPKTTPADGCSYGDDPNCPTTLATCDASTSTWVVTTTTCKSGG